MHLNQDFKEFIALLNKHKVKFIIVGAYAVGFHGYVRNTGDLDIWIDTDNDNAEKIISALHEFGFSSLDISIEDLTKKDFVIQLGLPPHRLDLLTSVTALNFDECYSKIQVTAIDGVELPFVDLESLKKNKRSTGRNKDLGDVENLP
jgi:hypothetical protein